MATMAAGCTVRDGATGVSERRLSLADIERGLKQCTTLATASPSIRSPVGTCDSGAVGTAVIGGLLRTLGEELIVILLKVAEGFWLPSDCSRGQSTGEPLAR